MDEIALARHELAQAVVQRLDSSEIRVERAHLVGKLEEFIRECIPAGPIARECLVGSREHGMGQELSIAKRVRHAVRGERILETTRVTHQRPAWTPRPVSYTHLTLPTSDLV